jgi:hypothetical protein
VDIDVVAAGMLLEVLGQRAQEEFARRIVWTYLSAERSKEE